MSNSQHSCSHSYRFNRTKWATTHTQSNNKKLNSMQYITMQCNMKPDRIAFVLFTELDGFSFSWCSLTDAHIDKFIMINEMKHSTTDKLKCSNAHTEQMSEHRKSTNDEQKETKIEEKNHTQPNHTVYWWCERERERANDCESEETKKKHTKSTYTRKKKKITLKNR